MSTVMAGSSDGVQLQLRNLHKHYAQRAVLRNLQLDIAPGQFVAIVGRSGCGKTTLLRLIAGLEARSAGTVRIDGQPVQGLQSGTRVMFQEARLLPWRSVLGNLTLGLAASARPAAVQALARVGLADRQHEWPTRLSGGQRQRVALARALLHRPQLLLLDEPLGALDALTRLDMHRLIEAVWLQQGFTALLVTHDVQEAMTLADRVILIEDGRIALDEAITLPRPRLPGSPSFAALQRRILNRLLLAPAATDTAAGR